jgi:glycosyltransferase involved in cell wall biosynthesis
MKISLIIPVRNEEKSIAELLDSLLAQSRKPDEIVITDGGSTDKSAEMIRAYIKKGAPIRLICVDDALPGRARNIAIRRARYDHIAMTDAGIKLPAYWLEELVRPFSRQEDIELVYGVHGVNAATLFEQCFSIVYVTRGSQWNGKFLRYPWLGSIALKKSVWQRAGGFREDLRATEDLLFFKALKTLEVRSTVVPEAVAFWRPRSSLSEAFSLAYQYAICDAISMFLLSDHTLIYSLKYLRKYLMYGLGLFLIVATGWHPWFLAAAVLGFVINSLLTCKKNWGQFISVLRRKPHAYLYIVAIVATLDMAAMSGFITGLARKCFRFKTGKR